MKINPIGNIYNRIIPQTSFKRQDLNFASNSIMQDSFERRAFLSDEDKIKKLSQNHEDDFIRIIEPYKDLTLDSDINLFENLEENHIYTVPLKYAIMASNSLLKTNDAHVCQSMPKVFEGLDRKKVYQALDKFACMEDKEQTIKIGSKEFSTEFKGGGNYGDAYLIKDEDENCAIIKVYKDKYDIIDARGFLAEIPVMAELSKRKSKNTPEFYAANVGYFKYKQGKIEKDTPWMLEEYITRETPLKNSESSLGSFFEETNMTHFDWYENRIGNYFIDMGGVLPEDYYLDDFPRDERQAINDYRGNFKKIIEYLKKGTSIEKISQAI